MSVLALRLAGPLQSWAVGSRHRIRSTLPYPSKSGVIGLLAAAVGIPRGASSAGEVHLADLTRLRMAVRVDQPGELLVDYQTASGASHATQDHAGQRLPTVDAKRLKVRESTKETRRYYREDAIFTAYLEGDPGLLTHAAHALQRPRYPLFLGRRSCPPSQPVFLSFHHEADVDHTLQHTRWQAAHHEINRFRATAQHTVQLDTVIEDLAGTETLQDQPVAQAPPFRPQYTERTIRHSHVTLPMPPRQRGEPDQPTPHPHDPFDLLD